MLQAMHAAPPSALGKFHRHSVPPGSALSRSSIWPPVSSDADGFAEHSALREDAIDSVEATHAEIMPMGTSLGLAGGIPQVQLPSLGVRCSKNVSVLELNVDNPAFLTHSRAS